MAALGVVIVIHIGLGWAFSAGLAPKVMQVIRNPMEVLDIKEELPKEEEPPPPPEKLEEIPPYVPPPDLPIELPPPPTTQPTITTQTTVRQDTPQQVQPAPEPVKQVVRKPSVPSKRNVISEEDYPSASLRAGEEGVTVVNYAVTADGRATDCQVVKSSGFPRLDEKACDIIPRRFRFTPATEDGQPVAERKTQNIRWQIRK